MIDKFLTDEQDPKAVEKIYLRLADLLSTGEEIIYIAVQKKTYSKFISGLCCAHQQTYFVFHPC